MKTDLNEIFSAKNEMVKNGQVVEASEKYFAQNAITVDFDGTVTNNKAEIVGKMQNFAGSIAKVKGITLHHAALNGNYLLPSLRLILRCRTEVRFIGTKYSVLCGKTAKLYMSSILKINTVVFGCRGLDGAYYWINAALVTWQWLLPPKNQGIVS